METTETKKEQKTSPRKQEPRKVQNLKQIKELIEGGIPLAKIVLKEPVLFTIFNVPENAFFAFGGGKAARLAEIWFTRAGVYVIKQNDEWKIIPGEQVKDSTVL